MPIREVTIGEDVNIEVERYKRRTGRDWNAIYRACASVEPATRSPYSELLALDEIPTKIKPRRRLYVLCLAIGLDPAKYGLDDSDRMSLWPTDAVIREHLASALATPYAEDKKLPYLIRSVARDARGPARGDRSRPGHAHPWRTAVHGQ